MIHHDSPEAHGKQATLIDADDCRAHMWPQTEEKLSKWGGRKLDHHECLKIVVLETDIIKMSL